MAMPMPSFTQRFLEWLAYARSDGQFQELFGLAAYDEPPSLEAYRKDSPANGTSVTVSQLMSGS